MAFDRLTRRTWLAGATATAARAAAATSDPLSWTLTEAASNLAKRAISSEELTKLCLDRIAKLDKRLNAFITVLPDSALAQARECDRQRKTGRVSSRLHGIPIALKDNIDTAGILTTAAAQVSRIESPPETRRSPGA